MEGADEIGTLARKQARDEALRKWIRADARRERRYGDVIAAMDTLVAENAAHEERRFRYGLATYSSPLNAAETLYRLSIERRKPDVERKPGYQERDLPEIRGWLEQIERRFAPVVDKATWQRFIL